MNPTLEKINLKLEAMSKRERLLVFATLFIVVASVTNTLVIEPALIKQKTLRSQLMEQREKLLAVQTQIAAIQQVNSPNSSSPQRIQLNRIKQDIAEGYAFLKNSREKLIPPEKMAEHLRLLLNRNIRLQLISLQTLPVTPLLEQISEKNAAQSKSEQTTVSDNALGQRVFKHGVQMTLRGNYLDLLQYVNALEKLPQQMFWAKAQLNVTQYPLSELTLVLYTLSLDKAWLQI